MLPNEIDVQSAESELSATLYLDPQAFWFKGHFPTTPILPGVAQLDWVIHYAQRYLAVGYQFSGVENIKFQYPLRPEQTVRLALTWNKEKLLLSFQYWLMADGEEKQVSSGKVRLCQ